VRENTREELVAENAVLRQRLAERDRDGRDARDGRDDRVVRAILDSAPDHVVTLTGEGRILTLNRTVTGRPATDLVGESVFDYLPPEAHASVRSCFARVLATGEPGEYEVEAMLSDGRRVPFWTRVGPVRDGKKVVALCAIARDVTRVKAVERTMALGALAGLAHDVDDLLMTVLPSIEAAAEAAPAAVAPRLAEAREAVLRAVRVVHDLSVTTGRHPVVERRDEDLLALVEEAVTICRSTFPSKIAITVVARGRMPDVALDSAQIRQALLNLCLDAKDAVESPGARAVPAITVTVECLPAASPHIPAHARRIDHLRVEITDNGIGLAHEVRQRELDPFFTISDLGRGVGPGLAMAYAIVKNHGGSMTLSSLPGKGSTVSMLLPVVSCGRPAAIGIGLRSTPAPVRRRILIIDDEAAVRGIVGRILVDAGYEVVCAADGAEGVARYQREGPFAAVLLDESMPGLPGRAVLERLLDHDPAARVVMFSGYRPDATAIPGAAGVLEKPVAIDTLLGYLRRVLERPAAVG
jgi:two-component system, cell cycle sensor histidine kinase and response regulator CckA